MPITAARVRELALALPGASERPHFHLASFRTARKAFANLDEAAGVVNFPFGPELRDFYCEQEPQMFSPIPGGWGRMGHTFCVLAKVDEATFRSALQASYEMALPKTKTR